MSLEQYFSAGEEVVYQSPEHINYGGEKFAVYITDKRMLLHTIKGAIFKKEKVASEWLKDIVNTIYEEKGVFSKKGILVINTKSHPIRLEGKPDTIRAIWQTLSKFAAESK